MSRTERKIVFSGEDAGVERTLDKLRQKAKSVSREIAEGSQEASQSSQETLDNINDQIRAIEKRNRAQKEDRGSIQRMKSESRDLMRGLIRESESMGAGDRAGFIEDQIKSIQRKSKRETQRRLFAAERKRDQQLENASNFKEQASAEDEYKETVQNIKQASKQDEMQVNLLREILEAIQETSAQEIRNNREDIQRQVNEFDDTFSGGVPRGKEEEFLKRSIQRDQLEQPQDNTFRDVMGGLLLGRAMMTASTIPGAQTEEDVIAKLIEIIPVTAAAIASTKIAGFGADLSAVGATAGGIASSAYKRHIDEALKAEKASNILRAVTGVTPLAASSLFSNKGIETATIEDPALGAPLYPKPGLEMGLTPTRSDAYSHLAPKPTKGTTLVEGDGFFEDPEERFGQKYGFDMTQSMGVARQIGVARGTGRNLLDITEESLALQRAFGLDQGQISGVAGRRLIGAGAGDPMQNVTDMIEMVRSAGGFSNGDFSRLAGILQAQTALIQEQSQYMEEIDPNRAMAAFSQFIGTGGSFDISQDKRATGRIMQLNQSLRDPSNQFHQAMNFAVLARNNEDASYFDLLKKQEEGILNPNLLKGNLSMLNRMTGGGDNFRLAIMSRFGVGASAAEELATSFEKEQINSLTRRQISSLTGTDTTSKVEERAKELTAHLEINQAEITNSFVEGATKGIAKVMDVTAEKMGKLLDAMIERVMSAEEEEAMSPFMNQIPGGYDN